MVASASRPGFIVATRNIAAPVSFAATGCKTGDGLLTLIRSPFMFLDRKTKAGFACCLTRHLVGNALSTPLIQA
jgi:hypothetical protein